MSYTIPDKYHLSREEAVFVAKKYLKESVYRSAHLEGIAVTFPQTEAILDNLPVEKIAPKDISKVCDLRDAWKYVLDHLDADINLQFLQDLQAIIAREDVPWESLGTLRSSTVRITGTNYIPELPDAEKIHQTLQEMLANPHDTDRAINIMLYLMRTQLFLDGNKRVATLAANRILIASGRGIFSVPAEHAVVFSEKLVRFYETNDTEELKHFIYEKCLTGLD